MILNVHILYSAVQKADSQPCSICSEVDDSLKDEERTWNDRKKGKYKRKQRKNKTEDISATLCLQWSAQVYSYTLPNKGCALKRKWAFPALAHHHVHEVTVSFLKKGCTQEDDRKFSILVVKVTLLAFPFSPSPVTVTVCALCVSRCVFLCVIVCLYTLEALIRRVRRERAFIH